MSHIPSLLRNARVPVCLLACYWVLLFVVNHIPLPKMEYPVGNDKLAHLIAYAGLAFLFAWTLFPHRSINLLGAVYTWFCVSSYGILDEFLQFFVAGRTADLADWMADSAGATCGLAAFVAAQWAFDRFVRTSDGNLLESAK